MLELTSIPQYRPINALYNESRYNASRRDICTTVFTFYLHLRKTILIFVELDQVTQQVWSSPMHICCSTVNFKLKVLKVPHIESMFYSCQLKYQICS